MENGVYTDNVCMVYFVPLKSAFLFLTFCVFGFRFKTLAVNFVSELFWYLLPVNPFTAMLAAPSLGKQPTKVPNLKSFGSFFPFA